MQADSLSGNLYTYANFSTALSGTISGAQADLDDNYAQYLVQYVGNMISTAAPVTDTDTKGISHTHLAWSGAPAPGDAAIDAAAEAYTYESVAQIARAAAVLASTPKWAAQYAAQIQTYVRTADDMVIQRFYVDKYNSTVLWLSQSPWDARSGWLAVIAASLYQATCQTSYLNLATTIGSAFEAILKPNKTGWIWDGGDIPIGSQKESTLNPLPSDVGNQEGVPDTNGANAAVSMVVLLREAGIVFSLNDVQRMANTLSDIMWNGSAVAPLISNYIDGSNKPFQFRSAPGSNAFVGLGWSLLAPYSQNAEDLVVELELIAGENTLATATTYISDSYQTIVALHGNSFRYEMFAVPPAITSTTTLQANVGTLFTYQIAATNDPTSYSASGLPPGLTLSTITGLISGTPTTAGSFTITLTASNANGTSAAVTLSLTISPPLPAVTALVNAASNEATLAPGSLATIYGTAFTTSQTVFSNLATPNPVAAIQWNWFVGALEGGNGPDTNAAANNFTVPAGTDFVFTGGAYLGKLVSGTNGNLNLALLSDSHSSPGPVLESMSLANALTSSAAAVPFTSTAGSTLQAGRQYWLSAAMAQPLASLSYWCSDGDSGLVAGSTDGATWSASATQDRGGFQISGAPRAQATTVPLATSLVGVSVTVGGLPAPLLYVGPGQINFQVPYEIPSGSTSSVVVTANGVPAKAASVTVASASPGIFVYGSNWAVAQNQDYSLNAVANPAKVGSYLTLYGTGGGEVSPAVTTGNAAPASQLSYTAATVTASINGVPAKVIFAGLAPGEVGLLQVDVQVPAMPSGTHPIQIQAAGFTSNSPSIAVAQ